MKERPAELWVCPTCGDGLKFEILDDERFLVAWSCVNCGLIRTSEPT
jgi:rubredoxin